MEQDFEPAFLLHHRPFRDSSLIIELFTQYQGRLGAVARSARGTSAKARERASVLQPFQLLDISCTGRGDLKTLASAEVRERRSLKGDALYAALYLNELSLRALHRCDPHPRLWQSYAQSLSQLEQWSSGDRGTLETILRFYELTLLEQLGYGLSFGPELEHDTAYQLDPEGGFKVAPPSAPHFLGRELRELSPAGVDEYSGLPQWRAEQLRLLKSVCRQALVPLIGREPLKSRELFRGRNQ
ncbi:DNA repair protein RecO (recombination protein O) [Litorivivens lipolytica]|uniref:DNA repair protein RecO n=1 Tax=Litorivivens lipolytica TaxID=1524264 RepID=A0A7W4W324_9GAMM|nr:DNA repair protein RecO [Litorivivens lipolytica]MBB3046004.1 DNA repair protein RecO (recombination protein O) [Litorivivens lipolytica]